MDLMAKPNPLRAALMKGMTKEEFIDENGLNSYACMVGGIPWQMINTPEAEARVLLHIENALGYFRECQAKAKEVFTPEDRDWKPKLGWKPRWEREKEKTG
jgi:hypothetical protein